MAFLQPQDVGLIPSPEQWVKGSGVGPAAAEVMAAAWIQSLARELPFATPKTNKPRRALRELQLLSRQKTEQQQAHSPEGAAGRREESLPPGPACAHGSPHPCPSPRADPGPFTARMTHPAPAGMRDTGPKQPGAGRTRLQLP